MPLADRHNFVCHLITNIKSEVWTLCFKIKSWNIAICFMFHHSEMLWYHVQFVTNDCVNSHPMVYLWWLYDIWRMPLSLEESGNICHNNRKHDKGTVNVLDSSMAYFVLSYRWKMDMPPWWTLLGLLSRCVILKWSHCNSFEDFEDRAPIYGCLNFRWLSTKVTSQWELWRLRSPASRLFTQPFIQAQIKENIKAPRHWPLWGELAGHRRIPRTKGQ